MGQDSNEEVGEEVAREVRRREGQSRLNGEEDQVEPTHVSVLDKLNIRDMLIQPVGDEA